MLEKCYKDRLPSMQRMGHCLVNQECKMCETQACMLLTIAVLGVIFYGE